MARRYPKFKQVPEFPSYYATPDGRIFSAKTRKFLKLQGGGEGDRLHVMVSRLVAGYGSRSYRLNVARAILTTFYMPDLIGMKARHRNGDRADNRIQNLYWQ